MEDFWTARPVLQHTLTLARARGAGPWAVLGAAMNHAVGTIPNEITLPSIIGGSMSLNLFVALVGPSGGGKGVAEAAALAGFKFAGGTVPVVPLGSGEGLARTFRPAGTKDDDPNVITAAIFSAPEVDTIAALASRSGATLSAELRKVYSGEQLGFANAGKDTRNVVEAGSYRACLTVGVQPLRSHALLGAADGGLPQRFVWLPTSDPDAPDEPPDDPGTAKIGRPSWLRITGRQLDLRVPEVAWNAIRAHRLAVLREDPTVNPLDGHSLLTRLKVAAALMALDGRTIINDEDWELAGHVMAVSAATRERCQRALADQNRTINTARALATAERDEIMSDRKLQRARTTVLRKIDARGRLTKNQLRMAMKADIRDYLDTAISDLLDSREIDVSPGTLGDRKVHMYHRYIRQKHGPTSHDVESYQKYICTLSARYGRPPPTPTTHPNPRQVQGRPANQ